MGSNINVNIDTSDSVDRSRGGFNANVEKGIFQVLADLIKIDDIVWDPVGAFFSLSCGYTVCKYNIGGAVYDSDGAELFLTQNHIDKLFAMAIAKKSGRARRFNR